MLYGRLKLTKEFKYAKKETMDYVLDYIEKK